MLLPDKEIIVGPGLEEHERRDRRRPRLADPRPGSGTRRCAWSAHISREEDPEAAEPIIGRTFMWAAENGEIPGGADE